MGSHLWRSQTHDNKSRASASTVPSRTSHSSRRWQTTSHRPSIVVASTCAIALDLGCCNRSPSQRKQHRKEQKRTARTFSAAASSSRIRLTMEATEADWLDREVCSGSDIVDYRCHFVGSQNQNEVASEIRTER